MDETTLERVARECAATRSRRQVLSLAASLSLASLLTALDDEAGEAKRHGHNRGHHPGKHKDNRKGKRHDHGSNWFLRGHSVYLKNMSSTRTVTIEGVETQYLGLCKLLGTIDLPPNQDALFDTGNTSLTLQVNRRYYFTFINPAFKTPRVVAGVWGSSDLCPTKATPVFDESMREGEAVNITIDGRIFGIARNDDKSDFKYWSLFLPPNLWP